MKTILSIIILILISQNLFAKTTSYFVVPIGGKLVPGSNLTIDKQGTLTLTLLVGENASRKFRAGTYRYGIIPKPSAVRNLDELLKNKQYEKLIMNAPSVYKKYHYLGWGDYVSALQGQAYLAQKKYQKAIDCFTKDAPSNSRFPDALLKGQIQVYLAQNKLKKVEASLKKLKKSTNPAFAVFSFNTQATLYEKAGKKQEAVLEYMKIILLFDPNKISSSINTQRKQAKQKTIKLLKSMKDDRWKQIQKL